MTGGAPAYSYNIGFKPFDLIELLVVRSQPLCDEIRTQVKNGTLTDLDDYRDQKALADSNFAFYYFSNTPGTINIANNIGRQKNQLLARIRTGREKDAGKVRRAADQLREHGINKQIIVMSTDELVAESNGIVSVLLGTWASALRLYDPSIILLNQIMYTFHRQKMILIDNSTMESWYWTEDHYRRLHPLLKHDFRGNYTGYLMVRVGARIS